MLPAGRKIMTPSATNPRLELIAALSSVAMKNSLRHPDLRFDQRFANIHPQVVEGLLDVYPLRLQVFQRLAEREQLRSDRRGEHTARDGRDRGSRSLSCRYRYLQCARS